MPETYDLVIVGAGPAGLTAAIYAARQKLNFVILGMDVGGQMSWSSEVENYPGMVHVSGIQLVKDFYKHLSSYGISVRTEEVFEVTKKKKLCYVRSNKGEYYSKAVIIASGKTPRKLNVPGEKELLGKGVCYCATCDAPLYKGKDVAVIGGGNSGLEAALFLSKYANKVYLIEQREKLMGEAHLKDKVEKTKNVEIIVQANVKQIIGRNSVETLVYSKNVEIFRIPVQGIFVEIGLITKADFAKVQKNRWGEIMLFRSTKEKEENQTSVDGIYAAGDVTDVPAKQIIVAAGEGCKAFIAAHDYIERFDKVKKKKKEEV